jgi:hypothetical protein
MKTCLSLDGIFFWFCKILYFTYILPSLLGKGRRIDFFFFFWLKKKCISLFEKENVILLLVEEKVS